MLVSAMTYNLGIWLVKKKYTFKKTIFFFKIKFFSFKILKKYIIYAYNYRLNQSGQHNL